MQIKLIYFESQFKTMADTTIVQSTIANNELKRIQGQPEKKNLNLSDSKVIAILINEALNAREAKKSKK